MTEIKKIAFGDTGKTYQSTLNPAKPQQISLEKKSDVVTLSNQSQKNTLPAILSFFIPGSGQLMNGEKDKAITHFATTAVTGAVAIITGNIAWGMDKANSSKIGRVALNLISFAAGAVFLIQRFFSAKDAYDGQKS